MVASIASAVIALVFILIFAAWRRYVWVLKKDAGDLTDRCEYSLTDVFGDQYLVNAPHQKGVRWLSDIFQRSARKYPDLTALQIPHTGESLTYRELDGAAENLARALTTFVTGPDQVVAVAMPQDNAQIVAAHLGILKAGATMMFLDTSLPEALISHMLNDAEPVVVMTRGEASFRGFPTLDVLATPNDLPPRETPGWLDDPSQRLAALFYTSGTTGKPKGVECPHAGYVNLALSYADYFDLMPGMDATTLTSSLGYDGSISEMYSAWVSGCSVVLLTKEQVRSGPDLLPVLREAEVTTLFCPPVLLTTLTPDPEIDLPYPVCRFIVPAGESFPQALVEPWTRGRRQIINTYGPTEASTDTSRQSLRPGEPVTIGTPFANVTYVILKPGTLDPLKHGEEGELCIGGVHLARGYRNLPQESRCKFIDHPEFGRLYRSGDRCSIDRKTKQVHFHGRIDAQLKVRGHRVETQAVEDILHNQFDDIEAAVLDYQNEELLAFVCAPSLGTPPVSGVEPAPADWAARVLSALEQQLPPPSVPSRIFRVESFVLKPVSGKIDRDQLPSLEDVQNSNDPGSEWAAGDPNGPAGERPAVRSEPDNKEVLSICREVFGQALGWDDVFADHGGHSIVIAQLAQKLFAAGLEVPVRALLEECDTARKIADRQLEFTARPAASSDPTTSTAKPVGLSSQQRDEPAARILPVAMFSALQLVFLMVLYAPPLIGFVGIIALSEIGEFFFTASLWSFVKLGLFSYLTALILPFACLLWVMTIKLFLGGHAYRNGITPGTYPKWSRMHLRVWRIARLESYVLRPLSTMFRSAPLMAYALRRLGAHVGTNLQCAHDAEFSGPLDLLTIGDDVAIQTGAYIHMSRWRNQELHIGPVNLESGCKIGMRAAIAADVTVGEGTWVNPFTPILASTGPNELWEGAPARCTGRYSELSRTRCVSDSVMPAWLLEFCNIFMQVCLDFLLLVLPTACVSWFAIFLIPVGEPSMASAYFRVTPLPEVIWHMTFYSFITTWVTVVLVSVLVCLFLRCTASSPGLVSSRGIRGSLLLYRVKKMNQLQRQWTWTITGQYLRALAGVRFSRTGASECDLMTNLVPEQVNADSQVFWSNGGFTNMLDYGARTIQLRQVDMPRNFFSGNNCVLEHGQYPSNFLLGVSTLGNDIRFRRQMRSRPGENITVAGNPPIRFASARFENENKYKQPPGFGLFLARVLLNDIISIGLLRIAGLLIYVVLFTSLVRLDGHVIVSALAALALAEVLLVSLCAMLKKLLVGSRWGRADSTPFWSWRHFSYFFAQDCYFTWCGRTLRFSAGTLFSNKVLRMMGCRIGKRTIVTRPLQASDWNAVNFGNDCMVNGFLQYHTFENMLLKVKQTQVGDGSDINFGATIMGGVHISPGTTLLPLSLVLKEMRLHTAIYAGSPAEATGEYPCT